MDRRSRRGCPSLARTRRPARTPSPGRHQPASVAGRDSQPTSRPRARPKDRHLPHRSRTRSRRRQHRSRRVAADRDRAALIGIVCQRTTAESSEPGEGVTDTLDHAQRRRRRTQRRSQQTRQQRGRDLMTGIREKARRADALHTGRQPLGLSSRNGIGTHHRRVFRPPTQRRPNALYRASASKARSARPARRTTDPREHVDRRSTAGEVGHGAATRRCPSATECHDAMFGLRLRARRGALWQRSVGLDAVAGRAGERAQSAEYLRLRQQARTRRSVQRRPPSIRREVAPLDSEPHRVLLCEP